MTGTLTVDSSDPHHVPSSSAASRSRLVRWWPWIFGLLLGVVMLGPALAPGPLFNLDLILPHELPVPRGAWGLGPELPRRVPMWIVAAWLSPIIGGDTIGKALMVLSIAVAFVGMHRLVASRGALTAFSAGVLYAASPFLLSRLGAGHLLITIPMALLPWCVARLLRPGDDPWVTFLWATALAFTGNFGGTLSVLVIGVGLATTRGRGWRKVVPLTLVAQLPWLVPGLVVYWQGAAIVDAAPFGTYSTGVVDALSVLGGHGFWQHLYQVGHDAGWPVAVAGVALAALAVVGSRDLEPTLPRSVIVLGVMGLAFAYASIIPGVDDLYTELSRTSVGSVLREGQRVLPLYLVWMAPAAALGARRCSRSVFDPDREATTSAARAGLASLVDAVPLALAVLLAAPGVWGINEWLRPIDLPPEYADARRIIDEAPGPVLALPWHQYFNLQAAPTRRVLNPMPIFLGGDVITSSDPELRDDGRRERIDPREAQIDRALAGLAAGEPISDDLARIGVRWIVLQREVDWLRYGSFGADPGLLQRIRQPKLELWEVKDWRGPVVAADGTPIAANPVVEPVTTVDGSGPATYQRPAFDGWLRGWAAAGATPEGTVALPAGEGVVWYWPSALVLAADGLTLVLVVVAVRSVRRRRRPAADRQTSPV